MKNTSFLLVVVMSIMMVTAVSCTTTQGTTYDEYPTTVQQAPAEQIYVQDPNRYGQTILMQRDPFTGQYYQVPSIGYSYGYPSYPQQYGYRDDDRRNDRDRRENDRDDRRYENRPRNVQGYPQPARPSYQAPQQQPVRPVYQAPQQPVQPTHQAPQQPARPVYQAPLQPARPVVQPPQRQPVKSTTAIKAD